MFERMYFAVIYGNGSIPPSLYSQEDLANNHVTAWNESDNYSKEWGTARVSRVRVSELPEDEQGRTPVFDYNDHAPLF